jgi:hypothetical protein
MLSLQGIRGRGAEVPAGGFAVHMKSMGRREEHHPQQRERRELESHETKQLPSESAPPVRRQAK